MQQRIKLSNNFFLDEFVDPFTYFKTPDNGRSLVNKMMINAAQLFRDIVGVSCSINNWWSYYVENRNKKTIDQIIKDIESSNTISKWSGIRTDRCTIGGTLSAHRNFKEGAIDIRATGMNGKSMFEVVEKNAKKFYEVGVRRLEDFKDTPTWLHMDGREHSTKNAIRVVDPKKFIKNITF
jgi:hypothetical protein